MTRKQARRRKQKKTSSIKMPSIRIGLILTPLAAIGAVVGTYYLSANVLDRPIRSIEVNGPFQRVTALQIEEAISDELGDGFVTADLGAIQRRIVALPWIDQATVARRWPSRLRVTVSEQVPAAIWGERGLLNVRGELFVSDARHIPAELPRLSGPEDRAAEVATRYLEVRERLIPVGLDLRRVHLDPRGAWEMTLNNGVEIRLGRRDIAERIAPTTSITSICAIATALRSAGTVVRTHPLHNRNTAMAGCWRSEAAAECPSALTAT